MDVLPRDSFELIQKLDQEFPHRCLRSGQSLEDAQRYSGKRELVDYLLRLKAEAEEEFSDELSVISRTPE